MTRQERNQRARRATVIGVIVSALAHVAVLALVVIPVRPFDKADAPVAMIDPATEPLFLITPVDVVSDVKTAEPTEAGGSGTPGASSAPATRAEGVAEAAPSTASPSEGMPLTVAVADTVSAPEIVVQSGLGRAREAAPAEATATGVAVGPPAVHTPGSAQRAKGGGGGSSPGSAGIGEDFGRGGITIRGGPKRHPKRHPPRGIPRRW